MMQRTVAPQTKNQESTLYVGNLDERINEALLWELMVQAGPVVHVHIPRDRISQQHQGYGFVELRSAEDAEYAVKIMNQIKLHGKPLKVNKSTDDKRSLDVGANLFIGNLAPEVDEKMLSDTFGAFGMVIDAKVARDPDSGVARGYGFVNFDSFEASDAAIETMNGQFLCNKPITISYAFKRDGKGERHGTAAERLLAMQAKKAGITVAQAATQPTTIATGVLPPQGYQPMGYPTAPGYPPMMPGYPAYPGYQYPPQMQGQQAPPGTPYYHPAPYGYPPQQSYYPGYPPAPNS